MTTIAFIICTIITIRRVDTTKFVVIVIICAVIAIGRVDTEILVIRTFKVNKSKLNYDLNTLYYIYHSYYHNLSYLGKGLRNQFHYRL